MHGASIQELQKVAADRLGKEGRIQSTIKLASPENLLVAVTAEAGKPKSRTLVEETPLF